ncbi:FkbM family methyltransferase [Helicobacter aurati]|uniref:FkbM family methyltransferase n=1 Tax=Helicobacter aurati TaxID=137778 RepID=A0A3D8IZD6_9HELI|nr:FkbM family methyltransferase [Helicobacter aurati]RDU70619.1 FkbM family methyltransferase [Helicobacter aurati]
MIKLDIESAERLAIKGMQGIITRFTPLLAVSAYHRYDDFIVIPRMILALHKDYKLYLRHYSSGLSESVFFFVPK